MRTITSTKNNSAGDTVLVGTWRLFFSYAKYISFAEMSVSTMTTYELCGIARILWNLNRSHNGLF